MEENLTPMIVECLGEIAEYAGEELKVVPGIKIVGGIARIISSLPDRILWRKIDRFLTAVPMEDQEKFAEKLKNDPSTRKKTVEHLILSLDKIDEMEKADILAKMFCALVEGKIQMETFKRLASSINAAFIEDLKQITLAPPSVYQPYLANLIRAGLAEIATPPHPTAWEDFKVVATPRLNVLGKIFQQIMRDELITGGL